mmetsp:Transcript_106890/g.189974  ORF Transcript_106890/g.189974 Transcript_106890/m.189974 type:complete len:362 (-) Transcript_106890:49-1134(-)
MSHEPLQLQLELGEPLGEGTSGVVSPVLAALDGGRYVVKRLKSSGPDSDAALAHEIRLHKLCSANCSAVVRYAFACQSSEESVVLMEACDIILWDALTGSAPWKPSSADWQAWTVELCLALKHCHSLRVLHRDVNPWNVFLVVETASADGSVASLRLGDFGLAAQLGDDEAELAGIEAGGGAVALDESALTSLYSAPELGERYSFPADVFSLGMTLLALWTAADCGCDEGCVIDAVEVAKNSAELPKLSKAAPSWQSLIASMIAKNPSARPSAAACHREVSEHLVHGQPLLQAKQLFKQHAKDSQGCLRKSELIQLLQALGNPSAVEAAMVDTVFSSIGGGNGSIDVDRFLEWIFQDARGA